MESEVRNILVEVINADQTEKIGLGESIRRRMLPSRGVELDIRRDEIVRDPPTFD